ncbi:MAG TPA: alanine:cation symporter family protein [Chlamydiales bacterium]|nr:alanine:cation symporter family protein [Chlamydiales bacterium]
MLTSICDTILFAACMIILAATIFISIRTRFVQIRFLPNMFKGLFSKSEGKHTIKPYKALFTAMSTTLGIGTIVGPVIAISLGGPGALIGFLLTSFFGSAATFVEVNLAIQTREKLPNGQIMGGPMLYLKKIFSPLAAKWYALCCFVLMIAWSSAQANQLAAILDSPLLGDYRIPTMISGTILGIIIFFLLMGGIKKVGAIEAKLIPVKFIVYVGACLFILLSDVARLSEIMGTIFSCAFKPYAMASGAVVGGLMSALRWGIFRGIQTCEAGVGTQTIPHSMAETNDPVAQGTIAMLSTYAAGIIAFLSGCVALMTNTWQDPSLPLGMSMVAASFKMYFGAFGVIGIASCAVIFAFGTILGNGYNGGQAFGYLTHHTRLYVYYASTAVCIFLGCIADAKIVWALTDIILTAMVLPHIAALIVHVTTKPKLSPSSSHTI